jgi:hypothetical protein
MGDALDKASIGRFVLRWASLFFVLDLSNDIRLYAIKRMGALWKRVEARALLGAP